MVYTLTHIQIHSHPNLSPIPSSFLQLTHSQSRILIIWRSFYDIYSVLFLIKWVISFDCKTAETVFFSVYKDTKIRAKWKNSCRHGMHGFGLSVKKPLDSNSVIYLYLHLFYISYSVTPNTTVLNDRVSS